MDSDKRGESRFLYSEPVAYVLPGVIVNGSLAGNISLSGIFLKTLQFVPMGAVMELEIRLGQSLQITWVRGQVVRVRQVSSDNYYEIGIKFLNDENSIKTIGEYVNTCRSENNK